MARRAGIFDGSEYAVLEAILQLGENAYGISILKTIEAWKGGRVSIGAVYKALEKLESSGCVSSWIGEPVAERGGRGKRFYRIEPPGESALREAHKFFQAMRQGRRGLQPLPGN
jgi:DNA-binding PadR family transcriptional regulator